MSQESLLEGLTLAKPVRDEDGSDGQRPFSEEHGPRGTGQGGVAALQEVQVVSLQADEKSASAR